MAASNAVLYLDTPENAETAADAAISYEKSETDLAAKLQTLLDDASAREELAVRAKQRADALYRWDAIAEKYERVFAQMVKQKGAVS
jgi:glycosyltransferase involved in cell wall biosynthesis